MSHTDAQYSFEEIAPYAVIQISNDKLATPLLITVFTNMHCSFIYRKFLIRPASYQMWISHREHRPNIYVKLPITVFASLVVFPDLLVLIFRPLEGVHGSWLAKLMKGQMCSAWSSSKIGMTAIFTIIISTIPFFFSVTTFSHTRSALINKLILWKLTGAHKNLGVDTFPDPVGHFGAPMRQYWIWRRCRWWASAPLAARLVFLLCCLFFS